MKDVVDSSRRAYVWYSINHPHEHCSKMPKHVSGWALMMSVLKGRTGEPRYCPWCGEKIFPGEEAV